MMGSLSFISNAIIYMLFAPLKVCKVNGKLSAKTLPVPVGNCNLWPLGNSNVMCLVSFMHKLCQVFAEYFKEVEEESIRDNFVIVYELLDEVMDYGSPQFTDSKVIFQKL